MNAAELQVLEETILKFYRQQNQQQHQQNDFLTNLQQSKNAW